MTTVNSLSAGMDEIKRRLQDVESSVKRLNAQDSSTVKLSGGISLDTSDIPDTLSEVQAYINRLNDLPIEDLLPELNAAINRTLVANGLVKTGTLRNSFTARKEGEQLIFEYDVPYAGILHDGGYIIPYGNPNAEPVYIAPRPWLIQALENFDFQPVIERIVARVLGQ